MYHTPLYSYLHTLLCLMCSACILLLFLSHFFYMHACRFCHESYFYVCSFVAFSYRLCQVCAVYCYHDANHWSSVLVARERDVVRVFRFSMASCLPQPGLSCRSRGGWITRTLACCALTQSVTSSYLVGLLHPDDRQAVTGGTNTR